MESIKEITTTRRSQLVLIPSIVVVAPTAFTALRRKQIVDWILPVWRRSHLQTYPLSAMNWRPVSLPHPSRAAN